MTWSLRALVFHLILSSAPAAHAAKVTLAWDPNKETVAGYRLYYGASPTPPFNGDLAAEGPSPVTVPLKRLEHPDSPTFSLTGMPSCHRLYFAVTAYDTKGHESDFSNTVNTMVVASPTDVKATPVGRGALKVSWEIEAADRQRLNRVLVYYGPTPGDRAGTGAAQGDSPVVSVPVSSSLLLTGLVPGQLVHLTVEAVCPGNHGARSKEVKASAGTEGELPAEVLQGGCSMTPGGGTAGPALLCGLALLLLLPGRRGRRGC